MGVCVLYIKLASQTLFYNLKLALFLFCFRMSTGQAYYGSAKKRWSAPPGSVRAARAVRTPDDVAQDVRGLKLRQRVSLALDDDVLRGELEGMISDHADMSASRISIRTYQDFLLPSASGLAGGFAGGVVKPVSDIRGADTLNYSKVERLMRCKVAAVYRLMNLLNWDEGMVGHSMCTVCKLTCGAPLYYC